MPKFVSFETVVLTSSFVLCAFNIWINYCSAVSISDLKLNPCYDGFCQMIICESITNCSKGQIIPKASLCGCCDACIRILEENEACDEHEKGSLSDIKSPRCRNGLKCIDGKCSEDPDLKGPCFIRHKSMKEKRSEEDYADDLWLPECDEDGSFKAKQVKKRKAICYDKQGKKLFGQEEPDYSKNMTCRCSRHLNDLKKKDFLLPEEHCTETGDFEQLQCIGDLCYCANSVNGEVDGRVVRKAYITRLPCYEKKLHGKDNLKECEKELMRTRLLRFYFFQKGLEIFGLEAIQCDFDGTYSAKQCDSAECSCTDKKGVSIKSYFIGRKDYENLKRDMNCDCARDVETVGSYREYPSLKCESYGNYRRFQCFEDDHCFCVDEDGDIISRMWNKTEMEDDQCDSILSHLYDLS